MLLELSRKYARKSIKHKCIDELIRKFGGGDSGIQTPDLRIMMKHRPIFISKVNGLN